MFRQLIVESEAPRDLAVNIVRELTKALGVVLGGYLKACLFGEQARHIAFLLERIDDKGVTTRSRSARIEAIQRPVPGLDRQFLMLEALRHLVTMRNAVAIGNDE